MQVIKDYVKAKKPTLSDSSITTYSSILKTLYKRVFDNDTIDFKKFDETDKVINFLKDMAPNKRKTILSSLVIITDKKPYRDLMLEDVKQYNEDMSKQEKSESQKENWTDQNQIKTILVELKNNADLIYKKNKLTLNDLQEIQSYIIMCLLGGYYIAPRRSKDFVDFKCKNVDKETDNFMDKNKMYFNSYKTAKTYGQQSIDIPKELKSILNKWCKVNPTEFLLFDSNLNKLSSVKLNQRLNKLFDKKKISVNALRHAYLTDKYAAHSMENKKLENDLSNMGSSMNMADTYIKLK